ncbi:MAG: FAD-dependent oxidoreductase [Clostridia bacterium]|nr:FAD-dependent oxidoreductase [Clostridia bacterium]MBQ3896950.1 FAD-dependent oxidoreductase [Clostridia bacterium]
MSYEKLLSPGKIGKVEIPNRIVMVPMGVDVAEPDGKVGQRWIDYYDARSRDGVGLIVTGIVRVNETNGVGLPFQVSMARDANIESLRKGIEKVHANGTKIFVQIHHAGRQNVALLQTIWGLMELPGRFIPHYWDYVIPLSAKLMSKAYPLLETDPFLLKYQKYFFRSTVSASKVPLDPERSGNMPSRARALTIPQIKKLEKQFIAAAGRVKKAGADGVELHASHGYLIQQFLSPHTNRRKDRYGGSLENRMRFILEIIEGVRKECGPDFPISVRLTVDEFYSSIGEPGKGLQMDEGIEIAKRLEKAGVDVLDLSCGGYETPNRTVEPMSVPTGWRAYFVKAVKEAVNIPVIAVGVIRDPDQAEKLLEDGVQDFIGLGRPLLADPEWAKKTKEGRPQDIQRCIGCLACFQSLVNNAFLMKPVECALNPRCAREVDYKDLKKDGDGRSIVVIGAGPSGLTAARELADRGFKVTVLEKESRSGGQLNAANKPPHKEKMNWAIEDLTHRAELAGAKILYDQNVDEKAIKKYKPYAVVVATGGRAGVPKSIPGADRENVMTGSDAMMQELKLTGKNIVVVGSGLTGLETAEYFMEQDNNVTIVEMLDKIGPGVYRLLYYDIYPKLADNGVQFMTSSKLTEIGDGEVAVENRFGSIVRPKADYVFFATGVRSQNELVDVAKKVCDKVYAVGDANKVGTILGATRSAFETAASIH